MLALSFGLGPLEAEFWRWAFLMTRIGAALFAAPFFGATSIPPQVRVIAAAALAALVANWTTAAAPAHLLSIAGMVAVLGEVVVGLALGFVLQIAFAAPQIGAEIISGGMGMGLAATVDPQNGARSPVIGQYFGVVLTLVFLSTGGHLQWIALIVKSYRVFPPGAVLGAAGQPGSFGVEQIHLLLGFATAMFATAVTIALPVSLVLMLVQVLTGVLSRSAPALNLFSLGLPAGIIAGIAALISAAPMMTDRMLTLSTDAIDAASRLVGG